MSLGNRYPILEFDADRDAVLTPGQTLQMAQPMPERCVICFFKDVIDHLAEMGFATRIATLRSEMGEHPVYVHQYQRGNDERGNGPQTVALLQQGVGAPLAAGLLEEVIALGARKFIACGGAGVLDRSIAMGHLLIPTAAVRDEGTSYHYLPPAREVAPSPAAVAAIERVLQEHNVEYLLTKTWTTDAIYRETRAKMALRRTEGCLAVEMEAAAMFAVAQFRNVQIGQILYGGDNLDADEWEGREWTKNWTVREKLIELAAEATLLL